MSEVQTPAADALTVPATLDGARLDRAVVVLAGVSRSRAKAILEEGVRVNGRRSVKGAVVRTGDVLTLPEGAAGGAVERAIADAEIAIDVRLETDAIVVVHKPAGIPTAPRDGSDRGALANGLLARYPELTDVGEDPLEPGLVHRLDNDTSGLLVVARKKAAFDELRNAIRDGAVDKRYLAIVALGGKSARAASVAASGELADQGTIEIPIASHPKDKRRVFACVHERDVHRLKPRDASTSYKVFRRWSAVTNDGEKVTLALVEASAPRALRHQIRVHFAALGAPLVGDGLYGGPSIAGLSRHALHASRIGYIGGAAVDPFVVDAPLPDDMQALVHER